MLYFAIRGSIESGLRIGSLRKMRRGHISENKTLNKQGKPEGLVSCRCTCRKHQDRTLASVIRTHRTTPGKLRKLTHRKSKQNLLFLNQSTGKVLSDRILIDGLQEMLVESGLATWEEGDSNGPKETEITSGKRLT